MNATRTHLAFTRSMLEWDILNSAATAINDVEHALICWTLSTSCQLLNNTQIHRPKKQEVCSTMNADTHDVLVGHPSHLCKMHAIAAGADTCWEIFMQTWPLPMPLPTAATKLHCSGSCNFRTDADKHDSHHRTLPSTSDYRPIRSVHDDAIIMKNFIMILIVYAALFCFCVCDTLVSKKPTKVS